MKAIVQISMWFEVESHDEVAAIVSDAASSAYDS